MSTAQSSSDHVVPEVVFIRAVEGYVLSRNYILLVELMRRSSVLCLCRNGSNRDVAQTIYRRTPRGEEFMVCSRGVTYAVNWTAKEFIADCASSNIEFLPPPASHVS